MPTVVLLSLADKMFAILPDYVVPYVIHLLAHDPDLQDCEDVDTLTSIKEYVLSIVIIFILTSACIICFFF